MIVLRVLREIPLLVAPLVVFVLLASHQLDLPGLYYDEAIDSVLTVRMLRDRPAELHRDVGVTIDGYRYPVMVMEYVGPINTYALVPFFKYISTTAGVERVAMVTF